jgi:hypothetical protein
MCSRTAGVNVMPGTRMVATMRFDASRSCTFSRFARSQESRNGF